MLFFGWQTQLGTFPVYVRDLGGSDSVVGICIALSTLGALLFRPLAGFASDRLGRRIVVTAGLILMIVTSLLYRWFPFVSAFFMIRFLAGIGWGISTTASSTIATDSINKRRFSEGMGYFSLSQSISLGLAPALGLVVMAAIGFRGLAIVSAGLFGIALFSTFYLRYQKIERTEKKKFAPYERSAIRPALIIAFVAIAIGSVFGFTALYSKDQGLSGGLFFTCLAISMLITRPLSGKLIDRFGFNVLVFPGFFVFICAMIIFSFTHSQIGFVAVAFLQGAAFGVLQTSLQTMAVVNSPVDRRGAANATYFTGFDMGIGLGNLIAGVLSSAFSYSFMFGLMAIPLLVGGVLYFALARNIKQLPMQNQ